MALTLTPETKNTLDLSAEESWNAATYTWDETGGRTWDSIDQITLSAESKNTLTLANEAKL